MPYEKIQITPKGVEITAVYKECSFDDCLAAAAKMGEKITEKLGIKVQTDIDPGDSACGLVFNTDQPQKVAEALTKEFGPFDAEAPYKSPREFVTLPGNLIKVSFQPNRIQNELSLVGTHLSHPNSPEIKLRITHEEFNEEFTFEIAKNEHADYANGRLAAWREEKDGIRKVHAAIIPASRLDTVLAYLSKAEVFEFAQNTQKIDNYKGVYPLEKNPLPEGLEWETVKISLPQAPQKKGEIKLTIQTDERTITAAIRSAQSDHFRGYCAGDQVEQEKVQVELLRPTGTVEIKDPEDLILTLMGTLPQENQPKGFKGWQPAFDTVLKMLRTRDFGPHCNVESFGEKQPGQETAGALTPELAKVVEDVLTAQAGGKRIPKEKYREMLAQAKPFLAKEGGITKAAYKESKGRFPELLKAAKTHRESKSMPEMM